MESLRGEIQRLDSEILRLVARREGLAREIGLVKSKDGLKLRDTSRERQVLRDVERTAKELGISGSIAKALGELLIEDAVGVQKQKRDTTLARKDVVVVGGSGRMGEWACRFLSNRGASVVIWDPRGKLEGYRSVRSLDRAAASADLMVLASPLGACPDDLDAVLDVSPRGVVFDLCSVKSHIAGTLRRAASDGVLISSAHPMFGPGAASPRWRNVLVCDCGCEEANAVVTELFTSAGANVSEVALERHDELMAYVLGLSHVCSLLFAGVLERCGIAYKDLEAVQGPSFERMARMAAELSKESKRVYHDIQALNPNTRHMVASMETVLRDLKKASLDSDPSKFKSTMESSRRYLEVGQDG